MTLAVENIEEIASSTVGFLMYLANFGNICVNPATNRISLMKQSPTNASILHRTETEEEQS